MLWLTWRQLRLQIMALGAAVATFVIVLAADRPHIAADAIDVLDLVSRAQRNLYEAGIVVLGALPSLIGAFFGAPLVAREVENGTHRLIWAQSVTRRRWLAMKLAGSAIAITAIVGALSFVVTTWASRLDGATGERRGSLPSRLTPVAFAMRGVAPIGYALFALALGVLLGTIVRKTLPAMALTIAMVIAAAIVVPAFVRPHLVSVNRTDVVVDRSTLDGISLSGSSGRPTLVAHTANSKDWILENRTVDAEGRTASLPESFVGCIPRPEEPTVNVGQAAPAGKAGLEACLATLAADGFRQHVVFVPANRFWDLQWREFAMFVAAAAVLVGFNLVVIRRV